MLLKQSQVKFVKTAQIRKQTTNKVPRNIFRGFKVRRKVDLMLSRPKENMKRKKVNERKKSVVLGRFRV